MHQISKDTRRQGLAMLTGVQFEIIRNALLDSYRTEQQLSMMVRIRLSENINEIAGGSTLGEIVFSLIEWAERTGNLSKLIMGAYEHNPNNAKLQKLFEELRDGGQILQNFQQLGEPLSRDTDRKAVVKILFLAANPSDTPSLRLDREIRAIDQALRQAQFRDKFEIEQQWAVRIADLQSHLLRYRPDIVHFSGHGNTSSELILENEDGQSYPVPTRALGTLFATLKDNIKCVVLNACYSEEQAQAIAQWIDCVVGMSNAISDEASISFAASFYQALGYGRSIQTAFDLGIGQIDFQRLDEQNTPRLLTPRTKPQEIVFVAT